MKLLSIHEWICPLCGFKGSGATATAAIASREEHLLFHLLTDPAKP
jgi:hypothetical protein